MKVKLKRKKAPPKAALMNPQLWASLGFTRQNCGTHDVYAHEKTQLRFTVWPKTERMPLSYIVGELVRRSVHNGLREALMPLKHAMRDLF